MKEEDIIRILKEGPCWVKQAHSVKPVERFETKKFTLEEGYVNERVAATGSKGIEDQAPLPDTFYAWNIDDDKWGRIMLKRFRGITRVR